MPKERDESRLLRAMGFETANVHLGTPRAAKLILRDLEKRPADWLHEAATAMVKATTADWREWRTGYAAQAPRKSRNMEIDCLEFFAALLPDARALRPIA